MLASHVEKAGRFLEDSWNGFESQIKENDPKEFPYLHLPIHSDAFQKTVLQQKQQTKYYRRVLKQEQPLTEKQVKNINQMKTQDEHYKQLIAYIQFDHKIFRPQAQQFVYCLQVCIINSFLIFRQRCSEQKDNQKQECNRLPAIRDYVQLLIKQIEPRTSWANKKAKVQTEVKQILNGTEIKEPNVVGHVLETHYLVSLKELKPECLYPKSYCSNCKTRSTFVCKCGIGICQKCQVQHCLEQQAAIYRNKVQTDVDQLLNLHHLVNMKEIKPDLISPRMSCCICKVRSHYQCSCGVGLCLKCLARHCLEQQQAYFSCVNHE
ncbi:Hypothetical_protein [Hexamita inflata]|uniref:Hypothetical_protein n=1 Tax=Hexamita inflata TaxID=28002 RepID=A0AA86NDD8_9EUKA|nr:Hypothetical protein HINF_LOCUS4733 [Hexamita inflata]